MSVIRTLIVDDEPLAQDILEVYLAKLPEVELVAKCRNALEAFHIISKEHVDLLLLDINMPEITGIDLLKTLKNPPNVIFTTAYSEYALESYDLNAIDYLIKPIPFDRFFRAYSKAKDLIELSLLSLTDKRVENKAFDNLMFVKAEGKLIRVDLTKLWFVEGLKDYVRLWTDTGKVVVHSTMKNIEDSLLPYKNFLRVHKSYIINIKFISEVEGSVIRIKGEAVFIGSTYRDDVLSLLNSYKLL